LYGRIFVSPFRLGVYLGNTPDRNRSTSGSSNNSCELNYSTPSVTVSSIAGLWNVTYVQGFYAGIFVGSFSRLVFTVCACFFIFCFRALSLSFLPLSPIACLLFPLSRRRALRPQLSNSRWLPCLCPRRYLSVHNSTWSVCTDENAVHDERRQTRTALLVLAPLSLTSDLKRIFLRKIFGAGIGNLTLGFLISRHDRPTLLFYIAASLPNILPLHFAELLALL
jgi:hypothetical protein